MKKFIVFALLIFTLSVHAMAQESQPNALQTAFTGMSYIGTPMKMEAPAANIKAAGLESAALLIWSSPTDAQANLIRETLNSIPADLSVVDTFVDGSDKIHIWATGTQGVGDILISVQENDEFVIVLARGDLKNLKNILN